MTLLPTSVPELSLADYESGGALAEDFIEALMEGLQRFGFVILKDHGVSTGLLSEAYRLAAAFFALPAAAKDRYRVGSDGQRGYTPFGREHAKDCAAPDLKEFWHVGREGGASGGADRGNVWPEELPDFRDVFLRLYKELEETGQTLLEALAQALDVDRGDFRAMTRGGDSILRILHYPPVPDDADPRSVRAAPHEDINLITILVAADGAGLELLDRDGRWLPVATARDNLIVDAGDMLARITNDVIPATTHRVVNPSGPNVSRYSMPFFMHARADAALSCIESCRGAGAKYPDITAGEFLARRLKEIGLN